MKTGHLLNRSHICVWPNQGEWKLLTGSHLPSTLEGTLHIKSGPLPVDKVEMLPDVSVWVSHLQSLRQGPQCRKVN